MDRNDLKRDWGPSALDGKNQAKVFLVSTLLPGRGRLLGGWQVNWIATPAEQGFRSRRRLGRTGRALGTRVIRTGRPLNPSFNGPIVLGSPNQWFNPQCVYIHTAGTYGNLGRGVYRGPGLAGLDLSLFKTTKLTERTNLQFSRGVFQRAESREFPERRMRRCFPGRHLIRTAGLVTITTTTSQRDIKFGLKLVF